MYELLFIVTLIYQLQNLSIIYAVEIQLFKQKLQCYTNTVTRKIREYFYPVQKEIKEEVKIILYVNKYKDKFQLLESNLPTKPNNILMEQTPNGNVIMFYDKSFNFYADKTIPTRFLETVARKYALTFKCKSICEEKDKKFLYLGKIANYSFLKKVENHVTNKKANITFKEFKMLYAVQGI